MEKPLKYLLEEHKLTLKKAFGQNFLTDENLLGEIVEKAGVTENDAVLEIGCGAGALTRELAKKAKRVVGYEIDKRLAPVLKETVGEFGNVEIIFKDVMKENLTDLEKSLGGEYKIVANLPYYITTPIVMRFLENGGHMQIIHDIQRQKRSHQRKMRLTADRQKFCYTLYQSIQNGFQYIQYQRHLSPFSYLPLFSIAARIFSTAAANGSSDVILHIQLGEPTVPGVFSLALWPICSQSNIGMMTMSASEARE